MNRMKRIIGTFLVLGALALALAPAAFGAGKRDTAGTLTVGATPVPHAELLALVADDLKQQGITLKVIEFADYVQPNSALIEGELDANFFQHLPYLEANAEWASKLSAAFGVHIEPFGLYSNKYTDVSQIPNGAAIAIPNDPTNGGRALLLLQANGLIKLRANSGLSATQLDIESNPKGLVFRELEAAQLPRALQDVDAALINGNYALGAGLNPVSDSLLLEGADSPYVNIVAVQKGKENDAKIVALSKALQSQKVKNFIRDKYDGGVVAIF
ncbi:ABC transporter substrate-binding protein [Spirochaetia bacterium]|nr:ABC transporter substrate-binding protein [Spirochaetia bacterium]